MLPRFGMYINIIANDKVRDVHRWNANREAAYRPCLESKFGGIAGERVAGISERVTQRT